MVVGGSNSDLMARFEVVEGRFVVFVGPEGDTQLVTGVLPGEDDCAQAILAMRLHATMADRFERREARHSGPYFVLKGSDGVVLATSCACPSVEARERAIAIVQSSAPQAEVVHVREGPGMQDEPFRWATRPEVGAAADLPRAADAPRSRPGSKSGAG